MTDSSFHPPSYDEALQYYNSIIWRDKLKTMDDVTRVANLKQRSVDWKKIRQNVFTGSNFAGLLTQNKETHEFILRTMLWPDIVQESPYKHAHLNMAEHGTRREIITETVSETLFLKQDPANNFILPDYALPNVCDWTRMQIMHPGLVMSLTYKGLGISPDGVLLVPRRDIPNDYVVFCLEYKNRPPLEKSFAMENILTHCIHPGYTEGVKHCYQVWSQLEIVRPWIEYILQQRGCTATYNCQHAFYCVSGTYQTQVNLVKAETESMNRMLLDLEKLYFNQFIPLHILQSQNKLVPGCVELPHYIIDQFGDANTDEGTLTTVAMDIDFG